MSRWRTECGWWLTAALRLEVSTFDTSDWRWVTWKWLRGWEYSGVYNTDWRGGGDVQTWASFETKIDLMREVEPGSSSMNLTRASNTYTLRPKFETTFSYIRWVLFRKEKKKQRLNFLRFCQVPMKFKLTQPNSKLSSKKPFSSKRTHKSSNLWLTKCGINEPNEICWLRIWELAPRISFKSAFWCWSGQKSALIKKLILRFF